jgi:hypothetical protein
MKDDLVFREIEGGLDFREIEDGLNFFKEKTTSNNLGQ